MISEDKRKRGSRAFCSEPLENIENYQDAVNDSEHMWECHHRREIDDDGTRHSVDELISRGLYFNRPSSELIFLRHDVHRSLHHRGKPGWNKGKSPWNKGKHFSEDTRRKISMSNLNHPDKSTPVEMTRISDGFTKVFPSQQEAARWLANNGYPNQRSGNISNCCMGRQKTTGGCRWRYV